MRLRAPVCAFTLPYRSTYHDRVIDPDKAADESDLETPQNEVEIPLGIVIARIVIVSSIGISAALAIFFLIGGIWGPGAIAFAVTAISLAMMFGIEKLAE